MNGSLEDILEESPVIAAVRDQKGLKRALASDCEVIDVLFGDLCSIEDIVKTAKDAGKTVMVHADLVTGLSSKEVAVDFIRKYTAADGIVTTKPALIRRAEELHFTSVLRFFALDSMAVETVRRQLLTVHPDFLEILPGQMPKVIKKIRMDTSVPVIAGGLIEDREDVLAALDAGAVAISTTDEKVWFM